jgi:diacylglycerol kinase (ATP)
MLTKAGHSVAYVSSKGPDFDRGLEADTDMVVVAGGDGTVAKVATRINPACPVAILPIGNANNIAKSLGAYGRIDELISNWSASVVRPFHLIAAQGPWGSRRIVEGLGLGAITSALEKMKGSKHSAVEARGVIGQILESMPPCYFEIYLDAQYITGHFLLLDVITSALVGPNLLLTNNANPSGRDLKICTLEHGEDHRHRFSEWLTNAKQGKVPAPVSILSGRRLTTRGWFQKVRLDDDFWLAQGVREGEISLETEARPVHFLVPGK